MKNLQLVKDVLLHEAQAIEQLSQRLDESAILKMEQIFLNLKALGGSLIISGVGKSGIIGKKIASTFSSLGLPAFFLHPIEALHGDLGRVSNKDSIILISKSGTTEEILKLLPHLNIPKERTIGLLGNINSPIGEKCSILWDCSVDKEACINNQAPTTSSTVALAMGDALAVFYESLVGLSKERFALNHPGGFLGKSLSLKVKDLMVTKEKCPQLTRDHSLRDCILEMTKSPVGLAVIIENQKVTGIVVEGDIRRAFSKDDKALEKPISVFMNPQPVTIQLDALAFQALELMENRKNSLKVLPVLDGEKFVGAIQIHDLFKEGFISKN